MYVVDFHDGIARPSLMNMPLSAVYSSTLSYIVDANVGRSSSAVACNSLFRGTIAFVAAEVAIPLRVCRYFTSCGTRSDSFLAFSELYR